MRYLILKTIRYLITVLIFFLVSFLIFSEETLEAGLSVSNSYNDTVGYFNEINPYFSFSSPYLSAAADMSFINDGKYQADISNLSSGDLLGYYSIMQNGYIELNYQDFFMTIGQKEHMDIINSDYSLFISGRKNPAFITDFIYNGDLFYYETRWIRLNERTAADFDYTGDRGANFKTYGLKFRDFRIGFQDAAVYLDRMFDLEYFINPLPQYFIQYNKINAGRPWETESNENNIIGAFLEYDNDFIYAYGQYLMDDFNLHWILPDTPNNPNKMAYAAGVKINSEYGEFFFDTALAFKYTFQATYTEAGNYSVYPYEYTYYPSSTFQISGETQAIDYLDNYIGYKYGENNFALQAGYQNNFFINKDMPFKYKISTEYVVSGSKSPSNPWNELDWHENNGTVFLDESLLEHTIKTAAECRFSWKGFYAASGLTLGYVFNELTLTEVVAGEAPVFIPTDAEDSFLFDISLTLGYKYSYTK